MYSKIRKRLRSKFKGETKGEFFLAVNISGKKGA